MCLCCGKDMALIYNSRRSQEKAISIIKRFIPKQSARFVQQGIFSRKFCAAPLCKIPLKCDVMRKQYMKHNIFSVTVYVKVYKNSFTVKHIENNYEETFSATKEFTTNRLLVGQFVAAESLLKKAIKKTFKSHWLSLSPIVVIQPMIMTEGGLSEVEERVFQELAVGSGGRKAIVWVGKELSNEEVLQKAKSSHNQVSALPFKTKLHEKPFINIYLKGSW